jgi:hypothetical protein
MTAPSDRVIISHPDGRSYSVTRKAFQSLYEPDGFTVVGDETPEAFLAVVPKPATRAGARRKTRKPAAPAHAPKET